MFSLNGPQPDALIQHLDAPLDLPVPLALDPLLKLRLSRYVSNYLEFHLPRLSFHLLPNFGYLGRVFHTLHNFELLLLDLPSLQIFNFHLQQLVSSHS